MQERIASSIWKRCPLLHDTKVPCEGQDKLEENQSKSKESTIREWSTSTPPAGGGDREPLRPKRDRPARAEDRSSKPEGQERGERSPAGAGQETLGVPPGTEPAVGGGQPNTLYFRRIKGIGSHPTTRRADRRGECPPCHTTSVCRSHRRTSDDGAYRNRRSPTHTAFDRMNRAQQWQRKEAQ